MAIKSSERTVLGNNTQLDKFKQAARELECDESEAHWDERLKKVVKVKVAVTEPKIDE